MANRSSSYRSLCWNIGSLIGSTNTAQCCVTREVPWIKQIQPLGRICCSCSGNEHVDFLFLPGFLVSEYQATRYSKPINSPGWVRYEFKLDSAGISALLLYLGGFWIAIDNYSELVILFKIENLLHFSVKHSISPSLQVFIIILSLNVFLLFWNMYLQFSIKPSIQTQISSDWSLRIFLVLSQGRFLLNQNSFKFSSLQNFVRPRPGNF